MPLRPLVLLALLLAACTDRPEPADADLDTPPPLELDTTATPMSMPDGIGEVAAVAVLTPTEGNSVRGRVTFANVDGSVLVTADISGLTQGMHGFHVHETGDCSAPDASSAGGHYNPDASPHGAPTDASSERHVGDLGNLEAGSTGTVRYEHTDPVIQLSGPESVIGRAVIVHSGQDDYTSQPSGDAGSRLACGVIEATDEL